MYSNLEGMGYTYVRSPYNSNVISSKLVVEEQSKFLVTILLMICSPEGDTGHYLPLTLSGTTLQDQSQSQVACASFY